MEGKARVERQAAGGWNVYCNKPLDQPNTGSRLSEIKIKIKSFDRLV